MARCKYISIFVLILLFFNAKSQTPTLDSLKRLIDKATSDSSILYQKFLYGAELTYVDPAKAKLILDEVITESRKIHYKKGEAAALFSKAIAEAFEGKYDVSLDLMIKANSIYQEMGFEKGVAKCLGGMGNLYYFMKDFPKALEYYEASYKIYEKLDEYTGMASCIGNLGLIYHENNQLDKALELQYKGLEIERKMDNKRGIAISYISISSLLMDMDRVDEAKNAALKSISISKSMSDSSTLADGYIRLAECYRKKQEFDSAQIFLNKSIRINSKIKAYYQLAYSLEIQTNLLDSIGNHKEALNSHRELLRIKDTLLNTEKTSQIIEMQTKFDSERKEKENIILTEQNSRQKITLYSLIAFVVLIIAFALNIYFSRRKVRSANEKLVILNSELQQQKEEILTQAENLLQANEAIQHQKELLEVNHRKITDSIVYASIIQSAMLPSVDFIQSYFADHFVLYMPRDVVSGDFYWLKEKNGTFIFAVADCTGHGVPGSLLSIMGISYLNEIISTTPVISPSLVLDELRVAVKSTFGQTSSTDLRKEGIEIAFCMFDPQSSILQYSGARLSLWISRNGNMVEYPADRMPIGPSIKETPFQITSVKLEKNDIVYLFTDGITDQLGGANSKKYLRKNFVGYLSSISHEPMNNQKSLIKQSFESWKGNLHDQTDDILVFGLKV